MIVVLVDKLLKTQIIECSAVANWLFSREMSSEFPKFVFVYHSKLVVRTIPKIIMKHVREALFLNTGHPYKRS